MHIILYYIIYIVIIIIFFIQFYELWISLFTASVNKQSESANPQTAGAPVSRQVSRDTREPYSDEKSLDEFVNSVERFLKLVDSLIKPSLAGPTPLDREWQVRLHSPQCTQLQKFVIPYPYSDVKTIQIFWLWFALSLGSLDSRGESIAALYYIVRGKERILT